MKTMIKILAAAGVLAALGYAFRKQITNALDAVLTKVDLMFPDPTEESDTVRAADLAAMDEKYGDRFRASAPVPDLTDSFPVGKRHGEAGDL